MKKTILIPIIILLLSVSVAGISQSNIVYWYDFTEGSGTVIGDGNGDQDAALFGSPTWSSSTPHASVEYSVEFTDTNTKYMRTLKNFTTQYGGDGDDFAIYGWFSADATTDSMGIAGDWDLSRYPVSFYMAGSGTVSLAMFDGSANPFGTSAGTYENDGWHSFCIVRDAGSTMTLEIDSVTVVNETDTTTDLNSTDTLKYGLNDAIAKPYDGLLTQFVLVREADYSFCDEWHTGTNYTEYFSAPISDNATVTAEDFYNSTQIQEFQVLWNGTLYNTTIGNLTLPILRNDSSLWNITVYSDNYFSNFTQDVNISTNHNAILTPYTAIRAIDFTNNNSVQTFTANWNGTNYSTNEGLAYIPISNEINTNVSIGGNENYTETSVLLNASPYIQNYTFVLYPDPSVVLITIYDAEQDIIITENITVVVSGMSYEETFNTITGSVYVGNLTQGIYTFKFSGANYSIQTYTITVGQNTYQELNAWLSTNTSDLRFLLRDWDSGALLEEVSTVQERIINNTWQVVSSKESDVTGRVLMQYIPNVRYRFTVSKTNYTTRTFELDPVDPLVATTGYTVRMRRDTTQIDPANFARVTRSLQPSSYKEEYSVVNYTLFNPDGAFTHYGIYVTYPGGSNWSSGTNPYGETLLTGINIQNASFGDYVNVSYWYTHSIFGNRSYSGSYLIEVNSTAYTWAGIRETNYGLTTLEKALIAVFGVIIFAGVVSYFLGFLGGGVAALLALGFFYLINFLTLWMVLPSFFAGIVIIAWRASA